jgi:hypothetical protein
LTVVVLPVQGSVQDVENARTVLVLAGAGIMMFWRFLLRIALAAAAMVTNGG